MLCDLRKYSNDKKGNIASNDSLGCIYNVGLLKKYYTCY